MYNVNYYHKEKSLSLPRVLLVGGSICLKFPRPTSTLSSSLYSFHSSREPLSLSLTLQNYPLFPPLRNSHVGVALAHATQQQQGPARHTRRGLDKCTRYNTLRCSNKYYSRAGLGRVIWDAIKMCFQLGSKYFESIRFCVIHNQWMADLSQNYSSAATSANPHLPRIAALTGLMVSVIPLQIPNEAIESRIYGLRLWK